jgi:hypothetical protein
LLSFTLSTSSGTETELDILAKLDLYGGCIADNDQCDGDSVTYCLQPGRRPGIRSLQPGRERTNGNDVNLVTASNTLTASTTAGGFLQRRYTLKTQVQLLGAILGITQSQNSCNALDVCSTWQETPERSLMPLNVGLK